MAGDLRALDADVHATSSLDHDADRRGGHRHRDDHRQERHLGRDLGRDLGHLGHRNFVMGHRDDLDHQQGADRRDDLDHQYQLDHDRLRWLAIDPCVLRCLPGVDHRDPQVPHPCAAADRQDDGTHRVAAESGDHHREVAE